MREDEKEREGEVRGERERKREIWLLFFNDSSNYIGSIYIDFEKAIN